MIGGFEMKKRYLFLSAALLLLVLCSSFAGCTKKGDPLLGTAFASVTVRTEESLEAVVTLDAASVAEHEGQYAYVYEIYPGETISDIQGRSSVASAKVASTMRFTIPLLDGERTRLYSTFAVCYSGGALILPVTRGVSNPEALASVSDGYLWDESPKGLTVTDVKEALSMSLPHVLVEADMEALLSFLDVPFSFNGKEYAVSSSVIGAIDARVREASASGAQVSLRLLLDGECGTEQQNALLDFLAERYSGGEFGTVSAWFLDASEMSVEEAAVLTSVAHNALCSRIGDGRIYVVCDKKTVDGVTLFFEELASALTRTCAFDWGAAIIPAATEELLWESRDTELICAKTLEAVVDALQKNKNAPLYFALCDVAFDSTDEALQAVSYAYTYAKATDAEFDLILYGAQRNDAVGLLSSKGEGRRIGEMFTNIDKGLTQEQMYLCKTYGAAVWDTVGSISPSRISLVGIGSMGSVDGKATALLDFSLGDPLGFSSIGGIEAPVIRDSAALSKPVLYTFLDAKSDETGVVGVIKDPDALLGASSLSIHLLAQYAAVEEYTLTLRLEGVAKSGERLQYEAQAQAVSGSWQTVSFHISSFVGDVDFSSPCVITLLSEPVQESEESFVLWVSGVHALAPMADLGFLLPVGLAAGGAAVGFLSFFLIYRYANKRRFRNEKAEY